MTEKAQPTAYPLRMPGELRELLESSANSNRRSLNAEIVDRLQNTVDLDSELSERTEGDMDHRGILGWVQHVEALNVSQGEELYELRKNPIVIDGAVLAKQVADSVATPAMRAVFAFLALQAAYPDLVTDRHRQRVAIFAARVANLGDQDPDLLLERLTEEMITAALEIDLGL